LLDFYKEIRELEARLRIQAQEFHERKLLELKPHYPPGDVRIRKQVVPRARANLRPRYQRCPEVAKEGVL